MEPIRSAAKALAIRKGHARGYLGLAEISSLPPIAWLAWARTLFFSLSLSRSLSLSHSLPLSLTHTRLNLCSEWNWFLHWKKKHTHNLFGSIRWKYWRTEEAGASKIVYCSWTWGRRNRCTTIAQKHVIPEETGCPNFYSSFESQHMQIVLIR